MEQRAFCMKFISFFIRNQKKLKKQKFDAINDMKLAFDMSFHFHSCQATTTTTTKSIMISSSRNKKKKAKYTPEKGKV